MAVTAKIKFTQGSTTAPAGEALIGEVGSQVIASNDNDEGVKTWLWEMLDVPPASSRAVGPISDGLVKTAPFTPDVPDCYLLRLTVTDRDGLSSVDERCFAAPRTNGRFAPPKGGTDHSMNFGGDPRGWAVMMEAWLNAIDTGSTLSGTSLTGTAFVMPAPGFDVDVPVLSSAQFIVGQTIALVGVGSFRVSDVPDPTSLSLIVTADPTNLAAGTKVLVPSASFAMPVVGSTVNVASTNPEAWDIGDVVFVPGAGFLELVAVPDGNHVTLQNLGGVIPPAAGASAVLMPTSGPFTMPAPDGTTVVPVSVVDSSLYTIGQVVYVPGAGFMQVATIPDGVTVGLKNVGGPGNASPGSTIVGASGNAPSSSTIAAPNVNPTSPQGPGGAVGAAAPVGVNVLQRDPGAAGLSSALPPGVIDQYNDSGADTIVSAGITGTPLPSFNVLSLGGPRVLQALAPSLAAGIQNLVARADLVVMSGKGPAIDPSSGQGIVLCKPSDPRFYAMAMVMWTVGGPVLAEADRNSFLGMSHLVGAASGSQESGLWGRPGLAFTDKRNSLTVGWNVALQAWVVGEGGANAKDPNTCWEVVALFLHLGVGGS